MMEPQLEMHELVYGFDLTESRHAFESKAHRASLSGIDTLGQIIETLWGDGGDEMP